MLFCSDAFGLRQDGAEERIGLEADGVVPTRDQVFDQLKGISPDKVKLVIIGANIIPLVLL